MFDNWTERAKAALVDVGQEVMAKIEEGKKVYSMGPEHLLWGLLRQSDTAGVLLIERAGGDLIKLRSELEAILWDQQAANDTPSTGENESRAPGALNESERSIGNLLHERWNKVLQWAEEEAKGLGQTLIDTEHLLLGLLREGSGPAYRLLTEAGVVLEKARAELANPLLSLDEAAKFLGISRPTLYRLLNQGDLTGLKAGRQWRFSKFDLMRYLKRGPVAAAAPIDPEAAAARAAWQARQSTLFLRLRGLAPALFTSKAMPLAIGIDAEIARRLDLADEQDLRALRVVLGKATGRKAYLKAMSAEGAMRHDLDGAAVEPVSPDHRERAQAVLEKLLRKEKARKQAKPQQP